MWELIAAAAAGLNAGAGLYVALAEHPAGLEAGPSTYWAFFPKVSAKAVGLSASLSLLTAAGAAVAYFSGESLRGRNAACICFSCWGLLSMLPTLALI